MHKKLWSENLKERDHSEGLGIDRRIILEWMLDKYGGILWTGYIWLKIGRPFAEGEGFLD
jgi:hypothetical protein